MVSLHQSSIIHHQSLGDFMTTLSESTTQQTAKKSAVRRVAKDYVDPYYAGILLGIVLFLSFFITGNGLGASGGLNRILVFVEDLIAPGHVNRTPYLLEMAGGAKNALDSWVVYVTVGVVLGGLVSGWRNGRLKFETMRGPQITNRMRWMMAFIVVPPNTCFG